MDNPIHRSQKFQLLKEQMQEAFGDEMMTSIEVYAFLFRVARDLFAASQNYLGRYGLSDGRIAVLMHLRTAPEYRLTPSELAERMFVTRGTMTGLLDGLEHVGLLERKLHTEDRRMLTIQLTQKGIDLLAELMPAHIQRIKTMVEKADLSEEEQKQLLTLLLKVSNGISALKDC
jgi:DNA-binding MarR family transcriptional regulator